jgi:hypothetical protein
MHKSQWVIVACALFWVSIAAPAGAVVSQQFFLSATNKLYFVVVSNPSGRAVGSQVTSIMMTSGTALPVNETSNDPPDPVVTSFGTGLTGGILRFPPLSNILRTELMTGFTANTIQNMGNPLNGVFDPNANNGDGLLTLPGGTRTVSFDGSGTEPVGPITVATGAGLTAVPAATNITITRVIGGTALTNVPTIVFPNPAGPVVTSAGASCVGGTGTACDPANGIAVNPDCPGGTCSNFGGETPGQNVTLDDTLGSRVGNPASQGATIDGFFLPDTTAIIVFLVDDGASAFGLTADGFAVTGTCSETEVPCVINLDCPVAETCTTGLAARDVANTTGDVDNSQFRPTPTNTPSNTPTTTATATFTATATNTATATATATNTATATATATNTATPTNTVTVTATTVPATATASVTATFTATNTGTPTRTVTPSATPSATVAAGGICRTKGFWGTHTCPQSPSGADLCEKNRGQNITQEVIDAAGGSIAVCGRQITDTHLDHLHSAAEALCIRVEGSPILQLASQLTAAALNCVISGQPSTCAGSPIAEQFSACNTACAAGKTKALVDGVKINCITAIDCANNGNTFNALTGACQEGGEGNCHDQPLCSEVSGLCFEPPGPAGGAKLCHAARMNDCTIFSGAPPCAQ